jgi:hypothetical protein
MIPLTAAVIFIPEGDIAAVATMVTHPPVSWPG